MLFTYMNDIYPRVVPLNFYTLDILYFKIHKPLVQLKLTCKLMSYCHIMFVTRASAFWTSQVYYGSTCNFLVRIGLLVKLCLNLFRNSFYDTTICECSVSFSLLLYNFATVKFYIRTQIKLYMSQYNSYWIT